MSACWPGRVSCLQDHYAGGEREVVLRALAVDATRESGPQEAVRGADPGHVVIEFTQAEGKVLGHGHVKTTTARLVVTVASQLLASEAEHDAGLIPEVALVPGNEGVRKIGIQVIHLHHPNGNPPGNSNIEPTAERHRKGGVGGFRAGRMFRCE
jgi:hypothetical protein